MRETEMEIIEIEAMRITHRAFILMHLYHLPRLIIIQDGSKSGIIIITSIITTTSDRPYTITIINTINKVLTTVAILERIRTIHLLLLKTPSTVEEAAGMMGLG